MNNYPGRQEGRPPHEAVMLGDDLTIWNERIEDLIAQDARIITLRGAGTVNGIDPRAADRAVSVLRDYITDIAAGDTPVVLLYDGDADDRSRPDIGSIFGSLADHFGDNSDVLAIAAQTASWYSPQTPNASIESATGTPFETYVFSDDLPGAHAALTQSKVLVQHSDYEQIFVGPAGPIAYNQLGDLSQKTTYRPPEADQVRVTILATANNPAIDAELRDQLEAAPDENAKFKLLAKLEQRATQPYGSLFNADRKFIISPTQYPRILFTVIAL